MKKKSPLIQVANRLVKRQLYPVFTLIRRFKSRIFRGVLLFVPRSFRSSMPILAKEAQKYTQEKLSQRKQDKSSNLETKTNQLSTEQLKQARLQLLPSTPSEYFQYRCLEAEPLRCLYARQETKNNSPGKYCQQCGFPAILAQDSEIIGQRGRYRIIRYLETRGRGRLYQGVQVANEKPVTIKEYLLPNRHFNQEEKRHTHNAFRNQGSIELVDGRRQDFRLPLNADVISPPPQERLVELINHNPINSNKSLGYDLSYLTKDRERCYLVTLGEQEQLTTLREYLAEQGAMSTEEVRQILNQVLQTLESLHHQKFRLPTGQIYPSIPHGNLNLESILIAVDSKPYLEESQLTIYLSDLALWENLFEPPPKLPKLPTISQDLIALGHVGFYLLIGKSIGKNGYNLSPHNQFNWTNIDPILKQYIFRLLEIDTPFTNAFSARQTLLNLPVKSPQSQSLPIHNREVVVSKTKKNFWRSLLILILVLLLGSIGYWGWNLQRQTAIANSQVPSICCISDMAGIPQGTFNYSAEKNGVWHYILQQKNLILKDITLKTKLAKKTPQFKLDFLPQNTELEAIKSVKAGKSDFAIISSANNLDGSLKAETFAYDGVVFFIAFSQDKNGQDLLNSLQGKITFEQLRKLYTGSITNWKQLGAADIPVKLYIPDSESTIDLFEQKVLLNRGQVEAFRNLSTDSNLEPSITRLPILPMLRQILPEFENEQVGSIGFGNLSEMFGQCSVYPLAIVSDRGKVIQPLLQNNLQPINPQLDLCKEKGSYKRDRLAFQTNRYPLTYPLAVVYPRDNSIPPVGQKFAEILKTKEGQKLLSKTGLIPLNN